MKNNIKRLIFTIYLVATVSICGYFYINPIVDVRIDLHLNTVYEYDYSNFKYSVLVSIVVGIIMISYFDYLKKNKL